MRVLFVHQNFPGQYKHLARELARNPKNQVLALAVNNHPVPHNVRAVHYKVELRDSSAHPLAKEFERKVLWGEAAALAAQNLKAEGFEPDIIVGHPGWGETLFLRDIWPDARILSFMEFYYRKETDFAFGRSSPVTDLREYWNLRARNAPFLLSIESSDWCVSPTKWQWAQLPEFARLRTSIIHDGIDTRLVRPDPSASVTLGRVRRPCRVGDEIVTFVNRNLEPYRGFDVFLRSLPEILRRRPNARVIIVGGTGVSYGKAAPGGESWKAAMLKEMGPSLDFSRIHFVGKVPYKAFISLLQVSAAHVYLTYPFVLSWSMLEAMSAECVVIGSRTEPVLEVLEHEHNGLLVDFFSPEAIAATVVKVLESPKSFQKIRRAARQTVLDRYDLETCLPQHMELISKLVRGENLCPGEIYRARENAHIHQESEIQDRLVS